ncbi:MAG: FecCD family ABC transporter permease [Promethearchaeota archaeon]
MEESSISTSLRKKIEYSIIKSKIGKTIKNISPYFIYFFLLISIIAGLSIGSVPISFKNSIAIILNIFGIHINGTWTITEETIVLSLRLPRVAMAVVVGGILAVSGVASQALFKNPIADPYIIGVSSSAGFGSALSLVLGLNFLYKFTSPFISFLMAMFSIYVVYRLAKTRIGISMTALLLSGIAISFIFSSLISFILYLSVDKSHLILSVLMGHLWGVSWDDFEITLVIMIAPLLIIYVYGRDLNLLTFGDDTAQSMGVNVKKSKIIVLFSMTLLTALAVAFCGSIGFVGLIIPNSMRIIIGNDNRKLVPLSWVAGGILLIWADIFSRTIIAPMQIPVGIFTSFLGGPFFIYLVIKKKKAGKIN